MILHDIFLFAIGLVVGGMNAIAGGGMLIGFPAMLATGIPALTANVTANIVLIPGQISSIIGYREYIRKIPRYYALLLIPCFFGGAIGAVILRHTTSDNFERLVPGLIFFAVVLFALQPFLHFHLHRHLRAPKRSRSRTTFGLIGLGVLPTAIYGGYFGAGFGFIMLAFLGFTNLRDIHKINAMKNIAGLCVTVMSLVFLFSTGLIDWHRGLVMAVGCGIGGYFGARIAQRISSHVLRIFVIVIGVSAAVYLGVRNY